MTGSPVGDAPGAEPPPGAQPERTALAWQRTILGTVLGALLASMTAIRVGAPVLAIAVAMLCVYVALRLVITKRARGLRSGELVPVWPALARTAWSVAVLGLLGTLISVVAAWDPWS